VLHAQYTGNRAASLPANHDNRVTPLKARMMMRVTRFWVMFISSFDGAFSALIRNPKYNAAWTQKFTNLSYIRPLCRIIDPSMNESVHVVNLPEVYERCKQLSTWTDDVSNPDKWTNPFRHGKEFADHGLFTPRSYFKTTDDEVLGIRPMDSNDTLNAVGIVAGRTTGFSAMSVPYTTKGQEVNTQVINVATGQNLGVHILDPKCTKVVRNLQPHGYRGGNNTKPIDLAESKRLQDTGFQLADDRSASMYLIPFVKSSSFSESAFFVIRQVDQVDPNDFEESFTCQRFWSQVHGWDRAKHEFFSDVNRPYHISCVVFPAKKSYMTKNNTLRVIPGNTHYGRYGEERGARQIRDYGHCSFLTLAASASGGGGG